MNIKKEKFEQQRLNFNYVVKSISAPDEITDLGLKEDFDEWLKYRRLHADFLLKGSESKFFQECEVTFDEMDTIAESVFFVFHYGPYFTLPLHFVKKLGYSGASFILTSESIDFSLVARCAESFGEVLEPIVIDPSGLFVKKVLRAKKRGHCIFILVDLPVGSDDKSFAMFDTYFGKIKHRLGYMRIAELLKQQPVLIVPEVSDDFKTMKVKKINVDSHENVISEYTKLLKKNYRHFERVDELARMCSFTQAI
ncbi:hypothetical protein [Rheinheimera tangshanensis]|uniref:Uncharacterized protein n=1 Tax=Rheinheimera tangshanensis TaxID=400153 RepID=A0A5C8LSW3_9GAMM|nr:hypothetical protein [Rheinheimera tangshanensis]TXK78280.1 hypothetical protein FU839_16235 [Rheinheimera tangshanensis]GGM62090.1 hypothetical protein GCM10010920_23600 [Rheinheimera tangshanensis]